MERDEYERARAGLRASDLGQYDETALIREAGASWQAVIERRCSLAGAPALAARFAALATATGAYLTMSVIGGDCVLALLAFTAMTDEEVEAEEQRRAGALAAAGEAA